MSDSRSEVAKLIIRPTPGYPEFTLVRMGNFRIGKSNRSAPIQVIFQNLDLTPSTISELTGKMIHRLEAQHLSPDLVFGIEPGGIRFSPEIAQNFGVPHHPFNRPLGLQTPIEKGSSCLIIDDEIIYGSSILALIAEISRAGSQVSSILSVLDYRLNSFSTKVQNLGIPSGSLTTMQDILDHPKLRRRFSDEQVNRTWEWYQQFSKSN